MTKSKFNHESSLLRGLSHVAAHSIKDEGNKEAVSYLNTGQGSRRGCLGNL